MKSEYSILPWGEKSKCHWAPWAAIGINLLVRMPASMMNRNEKKARTLLTAENPACQSHSTLPCFWHKTLPRLDKDHPSSLPHSPPQPLLLIQMFPLRLFSFVMVHSCLYRHGDVRVGVITPEEFGPTQGRLYFQNLDTLSCYFIINFRSSAVPSGPFLRGVSTTPCPTPQFSP